MEFNPNFRTKDEVKYRYDLMARDDILCSDAKDKTKYDIPFNLMGRLGREQLGSTSKPSQLAVDGQIEDELLGRTFFHPRNVQVVQNAIRRGVYDKTRQIIAVQNERELFIIMRSIFLQKGIFLDDNITGQVKYLNQLVVDDCITRIVEHMGMDEYYLNKAFCNPDPEPQPLNTSVRGRNTLTPNIGL